MATRNISITHKRAETLTMRVTAAIRTHAVPASQKTDEVLAQEEGGEALALGGALEAIATTLERRFAIYSAVQRTLQRETREDSAAQQHRDSLRDTLRSQTSKTARTIDLIHGRGVLSQMALTGTIPTTPDTLSTFVGDFLAATGAPDFALPETTDDPLSFDFPKAREALAALHAQFKAALKDALKDTKETQQARADRNTAHATWLKDLRFARDIAQSTLIHANQADLAARILPTDRQISGDDPIDDDNNGIPNP